MVVTTWISFGALYYNVNAPYVLPTSIEGCPVSTPFNVTNTTFATEQIFYNTTESILNTTTEQTVKSVTENVFFLYRISFLHYPFIGMLTAIIVGIFVSYVTKPDDKKLDPKLIAPIMHSFIPNRPEIKSCALEQMLSDYEER